MSDEVAQHHPPARRWLRRATAPGVVFSTLAVLVLAVIWSATLNLIRVERQNAESAARAFAVELVNTYEAQSVRALSEIDRTLKIVRYAYTPQGASKVLTQLNQQDLLPPQLLFVISITDADGKLLSSTASDTPVRREDVSGVRAADSLWVYPPVREAVGGGWLLRFGRALNAPDGAFTGAAIVSVDASYFVSGYDPARLGQHGMLGLLGTDGLFRARRSGDEVSAGDRVSYAAAVPSADQDDPPVRLATNSWDGVTRYTTARQLYGYPLAVIVGLSASEQLTAFHQHEHAYLVRAAAGSFIFLVLCAVLGRLSWQLRRARRRERDAESAHAQRVEYLAYHDGLTALPNRSLFNKLLSQAISQAQRSNKHLSVAFIDLDRFKQINDTLGHEAGDQLLREVAARLKACLRDSDIVARLGGDEFVVLLTDLSSEHYAATIAQKIITSIAQPFMLLGQEFRVTASIGLSSYPQDGSDEKTLTKNADIAMYQAKEDGKNNFQFYSEKLNANSLERLTLESSLRHAIERDEFRLHYQAKRDMQTGQITGMEALLRWQHPDLGLIAPMQFLPVAEETGLIVPIGRWVLKTACQQNVAWQRQGLPRLYIAVNLTANQFHDEHLIADLSAALKSTAMDARLLEIEIHERLLIHDVERTLRILNQLKQLGVRIAIDDFGAGYTSLSTLQRFPLDSIKIDRSIIRGVATRPADSNLAEAVIAIGKTLSLTVVAQGVETKEQAEFLRKHVCDEFQGFYFGKPVSAEEVTQLLRAQEADVTYIGSRGAYQQTLA